MKSLAACPGCQRHVKVTETACPFCRHALSFESPITMGPAARLSRAALFAIGTGIAATACDTTRSVYGGPPVDKKGDAAMPEVPPYGGPGIDAVKPATVDAAVPDRSRK